MPKESFVPVLYAATFENIFTTLAVVSFSSWLYGFIKFIYSEKVTKFCEIFTLHLSYVVPVKSKEKILQNYVAFSEYMNFSIVKQEKMVSTRFSYRKVASSNTHSLLGNQLFVKRSPYIRIKNPLHKQSEKACICF